MSEDFTPWPGDIPDGLRYDPSALVRIPFGPQQRETEACFQLRRYMCGGTLQTASSELIEAAMNDLAASEHFEQASELKAELDRRK